jgi:hypothetical protein
MLPRAPAPAPAADPAAPEAVPAQAVPPEPVSREETPPVAAPAEAVPAEAVPAEAVPAEAVPADTAAPSPGSPETPPSKAAVPVAGALGDEPADPGDDTVVLPSVILPPAPAAPAPAPPAPALAPAGLPSASPARTPDAGHKAELPSWPQVLATTIRLWAQRRLTRGRIAAVAALVVVLAAAAIGVTLVRGTAPAGPGQAGGALGAAVTAREQAATWVARQVAADAIVACDPAMCSALQGKGVSASRLLVLQSGNADPLGSDVVMATAAVRNQFGNRLASVYAPEVLTSFGHGSAQVVIRAVAPDGAAAYRAALQADVRARTAVGQQLIHNPRLQVSAAARRQLAAGEVDTRLLSTLATLAALHPIYIAGFGGSAAHASAGVPLRTADISGAAGGAGTRSTVSLSSLKSFLLAQRAPFLPAEMDIVRLATGQAVLRIEFAAPSPLGLLGPDS